jgi:hypothetical protein
MPRIQILELPTIYREHGDDETPFVLVIDQCEPQHDILGADQEPAPSPWEGLAERVGARAILVFEDTVEIPSNEVPLSPDGYPVRLRVMGDFEEFRQQVDEQVRQAQERLGKVQR